MRPLSWQRFLSVLVLLALPSLVLARRSREEVLPPYNSLSSFPSQIGGMSSQDLTLTPDELNVLGPGQFLLRNYSAAGGAFVNLYIAYFPSQRSGDTIHSPKNCLPGAGWVPLQSSRVALQAQGMAPVQVERYLIGRGADRDVVLYWYQAHGRVTPSEYWAKIYLVTDAIRMNRTDGALVRVVVPVPSTLPVQTSERDAVQFADEILPLLNGYIPR